MIKYLLAGGLAILLLACSNPSETNQGPPEILQIDLQDSLQVPPSGQFNKALVQVTVDDPDGASDVEKVWFLSLKPDSTYANGGNPIYLVDNGLPFNLDNLLSGNATKVGDLVAGDGIWTFTTLIINDLNYPPQTGTYVFSFYAMDKSGDLSAGVIDSIEVFTNE